MTEPSPSPLAHDVCEAAAPVPLTPAQRRARALGWAVWPGALGDTLADADDAESESGEPADGWRRLLTDVFRNAVAASSEQGRSEVGS